MDIAADAYDRAAGAHDELARAQGEAADLEDERGSPDRALERRRAAKVASNDATADRTHARRRREIP